MKKLTLLFCFALSLSASVKAQSSPMGIDDSPTIEQPGDPGFDAEPAIKTSVYPNPSHGQFSVKLIGTNKDEKVSVNILDRSGRVIAAYNDQQRNMSGEFSFNLKDIKPGICIVNIKTSEGVESKQIRIIQ